MAIETILGENSVDGGIIGLGRIGGTNEAEEKQRREQVVKNSQKIYPPASKASSYANHRR
jgi:hypothetical protein